MLAVEPIETGDVVLQLHLHNTLAVPKHDAAIASWRQGWLQQFSSTWSLLPRALESFLEGTATSATPLQQKTTNKFCNSIHI
jgi:hypothetical protein